LLRPDGPAAPAGEPPDAPGAPAAKADLYGDPLPDGAVLRLGTLKQRAVGARVALAADGKTRGGGRGGQDGSGWGAESGRLQESRELPCEPWGDSYLSPDGRWLATDDGPLDQFGVWDLKTGRKKLSLAVPGASYVMPAAFSPDGKNVAVVGNANG